MAKCDTGNARDTGTQNSEIELRLNRTFLKVLVDGDGKKLMLPGAISKELDMSRKREVGLESRFGRWDVRIQRNVEDGRLYFGHGWPEFAREHNLEEWQVLEFRHLGNMLIEVSIMGIDGAEIYSLDSKKGKGPIVEMDMPVRQPELCVDGASVSKVKNDLPHSASVATDKENVASASGTKTELQLAVGASPKRRMRDEEAPVIKSGEGEVVHTINLGSSSKYAVALGRRFIRATNLQHASGVMLRGPDGFFYEVDVIPSKHKDGNDIVKFGGQEWTRFYRFYKLHKKKKCILTAPRPPDEDSFPGTIDTQIC